MRQTEGTAVRLASFVLVIVLVVDAPRARADFAFGTPTKFGPPLNSGYVEDVDCISADGLELYFDSRRPGGLGNFDLWVARRDTTDAAWGEPVNLGPAVNSAYAETYACLSPDGLELYFNSENRPGGYGDWDLWVTKRTTKEDPWGPPVNLGPTVNGPAGEVSASISADGLELYFMVGTYWVGSTIWVTRRETENDPWGTPAKLGPTINSAAYQGLLCLSPDGLTLFFCDAWPSGPFRSGGLGGEDIWVTTRATPSDEWGIPRNLGRPVNSPLNEDSPRLSPDGSTLYFNRGTTSVHEVWQAPIVPIVDFNGDGKVDLQDLQALIEHWGQKEPAFDIAPPPLGDGTVDAKDLEVLMCYWQQNVNDPRLAAHWKLDETEGIVAADGIRSSNGTLIGNSIWEPAGGKLGGAVRLDGMGACVSTPFVSDPSEGPFSVSAWIKGGASGQVIVSQDKGANWLMLAPDGALMTELKQPGRQGKPLVSPVVVTDGAWHRVGLVWDGSNRILYLDGVEVAADTQTTLRGTYTGLHIGAGATFAPGTFWKGLIDDVRIYDRAVKP